MVSFEGQMYFLEELAFHRRSETRKDGRQFSMEVPFAKMTYNIHATTHALGVHHTECSMQYTVGLHASHMQHA